MVAPYANVHIAHISHISHIAHIAHIALVGGVGVPPAYAWSLSAWRCAFPNRT